jgi:predicted glycosyltransferase
MGEAGARRSLLFYCQHVLGMGHLIRSLALAESLAARFHVVFLNGGPVPHGVRRPPGIDFIDLPPLGFDPAGRLVSRDRRRSAERALGLRGERILTTFHRLRPRAVVVELFPFGRKKFANELLPLFEAVHVAGPERPLLVTSLRDILVTGRRDQERHDERACTLANRFLDAILVHADPRFARLEDSFQPTERLRVPVHYTGFVTSRSSSPAPAPSPAHRLIVSAGGGLVGARLFRAAVEAHPLLFEREGLRTLLVAGPFLPETDWQALREGARGRPGLELRRSVPSLEAELVRAAVSVSQCGYNAALEILRTHVRALVVPFSEGGEDEQRVRARRLERLGAVRVLEPEQVDGPTLAAGVQSLLHFTPQPVALDMDGTGRTVKLLETLLVTHEGSRTLDYGMA